MNFDSAVPDLEANKTPSDVDAISTLSDVEPMSTLFDGEPNSTVSETEVNSVLPEVEVNSVLLYLKSNSSATEPTPNYTQSEPSSVELELADLSLSENKVDYNFSIELKTEGEKLLLILPPESQVPTSERYWSELWQQIKLRLLASDRFLTSQTGVQVVARDRLLDSRQLQELGEILNQAQLQIKSISTSRRQTAIAAASAGYSVEQLPAEKALKFEPKVVRPPLAEPLYLKMTVRSGVEIRHPGTVIILGDLNPGGIVIADGDILVWGRLRGIAHAGAKGNHECLIMALQMEPTQLRIADAVARAPENSPVHFYPEVAYNTPQGIRIAKATDFSRTLLSRVN